MVTVRLGPVAFAAVSLDDAASCREHGVIVTGRLVSGTVERMTALADTFAYRGTPDFEPGERRACRAAAEKIRKAISS